MTDRQTEKSVCCETICENLSAMHDGELLTVPYGDVAQHLNECAVCRTYQINLPILINKISKEDNIACDVDRLWSSVLNEIENDLTVDESATVKTLRGKTLWPSKHIRQWLASVSLAASVIIGVLTGAVLMTVPDNLHSAAVVSGIVRDFESFQSQGRVFDVTEHGNVSSVSWVSSMVDFDLSAAINTPSGYQTAGVRLCSLFGKEMAFIQYINSEKEALSLYVMQAAEIDLPKGGPRLAGHTSDGLTTLAWKKGDVGYVVISGLSVERINSLLSPSQIDANTTTNL